MAGVWERPACRTLSAHSATRALLHARPLPRRQVLLVCLPIKRRGTGCPLPRELFRERQQLRYAATQERKVALGRHYATSTPGTVPRRIGVSYEV